MKILLLWIVSFNRVDVNRCHIIILQERNVKTMDVILYGLGQGLNLVEKMLKKEYKIIGYTDSYAKLTIFKGKPFYQLNEIRKIQFDYIIITVYERGISWEIFNVLHREHGISKQSIIPFYCYAKFELYESKLKKYNLNELKGLIFGNSHAACGFLENEIEMPFANLAISGQDIYYNYLTYKQCLKISGEKLRKLQYIIIDMYDYCYFNFDTSLTENAIKYIFSGGILDEHNFEKNCGFTKSFYEELAVRRYFPEKLSCMKQLFYDTNIDYNHLQSDKRYNHIEKNTMLSQGPILGSIVRKRNLLTIDENIKLMHLFLSDIKKNHKNINIIFTLIPRYIDMEYIYEPFIKSWKNEFTDILKVLCSKYNAFFINYKICKELSENPMFYYDVEHMNTVGGTALSSLLNKDLKRMREA